MQIKFVDGTGLQTSVSGVRGVWRVGERPAGDAGTRKIGGGDVGVRVKKSEGPL